MIDTTRTRSEPQTTAASLASREVRARLVDDLAGTDPSTSIESASADARQGDRFIVVESGGRVVAIVCIRLVEERLSFGRMRARWIITDTSERPGMTVHAPSLRRSIERRVLDTVFSVSDWQVFEWHQVADGSSLDQALQRRFSRAPGHGVVLPIHRFERTGWRALQARVSAGVRGLFQRPTDTS